MRFRVDFVNELQKCLRHDKRITLKWNQFESREMEFLILGRRCFIFHKTKEIGQRTTQIAAVTKYNGHPTISDFLRFVHFLSSFYRISK